MKFHPLISSWNHCTPTPSTPCNDSTKRSRDEIPTMRRRKEKIAWVLWPLFKSSNVTHVCKFWSLILGTKLRRPPQEIKPKGGEISRIWFQRLLFKLASKQVYGCFGREFLIRCWNSWGLSIESPRARRVSAILRFVKNCFALELRLNRLSELSRPVCAEKRLDWRRQSSWRHFRTFMI